MPSKNLSIREADEHLWQRAEQRAKASSISLSSLVAQALAVFLDEDEDTYSQISVQVNGRREGFRGRWLVRPLLPDRPFIAETARGRIALYIPAEISPDGSDMLLDYDTLDAAEQANQWIAPELWDHARRAVPKAVIWRDI